MKILSKIKFEYGITVIYLIIGLIGIVVADKILDSVIVQHGFHSYSIYHTFKDIVIIVLTAGLMFFLIRQHLHKLKKAELEIQSKSKEVEALHEEFTAQNIELLSSKEKSEESEALFRGYINHSIDGVFIVDEKGNYLEVNPAASIITGYSHAELCNMNLMDLVPDTDKSLASEHFSNVVKKGEYSCELHFLKKDKSLGCWIVSAIKLNDKRFLGFAKDISIRKKAEESLQLLNRKLRAISNCNQTLLRSDNEQTLLNEICRIICDEAGYMMAWVGYVENDEAKTIRPVAWAGNESGYIADAKLSWSDETERGRGPAGQAIRKGEMICVQDFTTDPNMVPWRENALQRGYRSGIAMPLKDENNKVFGVLLTYYPQTNAISAEEILLMTELSGDLAFGINAIRTRAKRKSAENIMKARLRLLEFANSHTMEELLMATLDEIEALTGSTIGFYHFLEPDQKSLLLQNWSTNTLQNMCTAEGKGSHYDIANAGVWVDCVLERRPVIHKNYDSLPHRKGMPEGHAPVINELIVPVFRGNLITAIIGTGNKIDDFDENDIEIVSQLGDLSWDIAERMRSEETLQHSEKRKTLLNKIATIFLTTPDEEMYSEIMSLILELTKSKFGLFGFIEDNGDLVIPSLTRDVWNECQVTEKSSVFPAGTWGKSLWGKSIKEKRPYFSTGPFHTPDGHIQMENFLSVPIVYGNETIALLCFANNENGYTHEDEALLVDVAHFISPILNARLQRDRLERVRYQAEIELIKAKEKAEEGDRLKTAFLQNISHEIRTPMNAICGFSDLLNKPGISDEKRDYFTTIIQNSSSQLLSIVNNILTISSIETHQENVNITNTSVNNIIVELLSIFTAQANNQNVSLYSVKPLSDKQSEIYTDRTKLTQVLINLIANALKFTHEGFVEFGYNLKDNFLEFFVKDTGIGIKPEMQEKIFERFRQADATIQVNYGGTGLGLSISKAFVELLGGSVWVESEPGKGSVFYFSIPYKPVNEAVKADKPKKPVKSNIEILIAEDEQYNYLFIEELLMDRNYKLFHTKDGKETVDLCKATPTINLILMDIKMPVMDGHTAAKQIKELRPELPIIAQSAYALVHEIEKYSGPFDDYLTKPIKKSELISLIDKYIT